MLLAIDVGNTNIVIGEFQGQTLVNECRLKTDVTRPRDEYAVFLKSLLQSNEAFDGAILSSVVPALTLPMKDLVQDLFGLDPVVVGPGVKTGLVIKVTNPQGVGADRIVNAVAAKTLYGSPAIVLDFGTATSFDVIDSNDHYLGGAIAPGVEVALSGLVKRTAKLPRIGIEMPHRAVGRNTLEAMQSGTSLGYLCLCEGLIDRIKAEVGEATVIATGGLGSVFSQHSKKINEFDPHLTLKGLQILASLNGIA